MAVAMFVITVVSLTGFAYYGTARMGEINEWHDQNSLFLAEREIEAWHGNGYTGLQGFSLAQSAPNFLPYGYRFGSPDAAWDQANRRKVVVLDGFTYHIRARNHFTNNSGNNYYVYEDWGGVPVFYRRVEVRVEWGFVGGTPLSNMSQETRMAQ
ncbi:MAG: hypothetical protein K8I27_05425 [Planctomycetes bacterium]|nr:hypothetical protein [Planctomycetota bacterium]